jgi:hypothetical protein
MFSTTSSQIFFFDNNAVFKHEICHNIFVIARVKLFLLQMYLSFLNIQSKIVKLK